MVQEFRKAFPQQMSIQKDFVSTVALLEKATSNSSLLAYHQFVPPSEGVFIVQIKELISQLTSLTTGNLSDFLAITLPLWITELSEVNCLKYSQFHQLKRMH